MTQVLHRDSGGTDAIKSDGTPGPHEPFAGVTFPSTGVWFFQLGDADSTQKHITLKWNTALIANITIDCTSIPHKKGGAAQDDANDLSPIADGAGSGWNREAPTSGYVSVTDSAGGTGGA